MWSGEILGHVNHHCTQGLGGQNHAAVHQLSFLHPLSSFMSRRTPTKTRSPHSKHREVFSFNQHQPTVGRVWSASRYSDCQLCFLLSFSSFILPLWEENSQRAGTQTVSYISFCLSLPSSGPFYSNRHLKLFILS